MRVPGSRGHFVSSGHLHAPTHSQHPDPLWSSTRDCHISRADRIGFFHSAGRLPHRSRADAPRAGAARQELDPEAIRHGAAGADAAGEDRHVDHRLARIQRRPGVPIDVAADDVFVAPPDDPRVQRSRRAGRAPVDRAVRLRRLYTVVPTANDEQWDGLRKVVEERDPQVIGINTSEAWNHADGLTANEKEQLLRALGPKYGARVRSAEMLAVGWLETKIPEETDAYRHVMTVAHKIIAEAFSNAVDQAWRDDERGRRLVDAAARRRHGTGPLVPSLNHHSAQGRRPADAPPARA